MPNSIRISWLYILTTCIKISSSFSFFENSLMSCMYIKWLIFSWDRLSLCPAVHFLSIWFSGIMAIMNCNGDSASTWKVTIWMFASAKLLPKLSYAFLKSTKAIARFFHLVCSYLGCVDLCKLTLLCFWILCDLFIVSQGTNHHLLASSKSLPLFVMLILPTSSVGTLWVFNCLGRSLCFGSFWINVFLPLVIHLRTCALCKHLFISVMDGGKFLEPETM